MNMDEELWAFALTVKRYEMAVEQTLSLSEDSLLRKILDIDFMMSDAASKSFCVPQGWHQQRIMSAAKKAVSGVAQKFQHIQPAERQRLSELSSDFLKRCFFLSRQLDPMPAAVAEQKAKEQAAMPMLPIPDLPVLPEI